MRTRQITPYVGAALASALMLAACAAPPAPPTAAPIPAVESTAQATVEPTPEPTTEPTAPAAPAGDALAGTNWMLATLGGNPPVANTAATLNFGTDGKAGGNDSCNAFGGSYTVDGNSLKFSALIGTLIACEEPIMKQADAFRKALEQTAQFAVAGDTLTLSDASGSALATFMKQSMNLAGTTWNVTNFNNGQQAVVGVQEGTSLTVRFAEGGQVSGNAGCNNFTGAYTQENTTIKIGPLAVTQKMCAEPAGVMEQEAQFLKALESATVIQLDGNSLTLRTAEDAMAVVMSRAIEASDLSGTNWVVTGFNNGKQAVVSPLTGTELTVSFGADGRVSGSAGCNNFTGPFSQEEQPIKIGPLASTLKTCSDPAGVMEQEMQFLAALQSAATYLLDGDTVTMRTSDDAIAVTMRRAP